nr:hypothetical protein [Arthrobacter sp. 35W]
MSVTYVDADLKSRRNPLRDGRDRRLSRVADPSSLVLFGVTGDLARKKLMPAVYDLANRGLLPIALQVRGRYVASYAIQGAKLSNPTKHWERKLAEYQDQFAQR